MQDNNVYMRNIIVNDKIIILCVEMNKSHANIDKTHVTVDIMYLAYRGRSMPLLKFRSNSDL